MLSSTANVEGLLDAEPDALVGADSAGMIQSVNHQTELLFGYDPDDFFGLSVEVLVPQSARRIHQVHREGFNTHPKNQTMRSGLKVRERRHHCTQFPVEVSLSELKRFQQISIEGVLNVIELKKEIESPKGSGTTERGESNEQR